MKIVLCSRTQSLYAGAICFASAVLSCICEESWRWLWWWHLGTWGLVTFLSQLQSSPEATPLHFRKPGLLSGADWGWSPGSDSVFSLWPCANPLASLILIVHSCEMGDKTMSWWRCWSRINEIKQTGHFAQGILSASHLHLCRHYQQEPYGTAYHLQAWQLPTLVGILFSSCDLAILFISLARYVTLCRLLYLCLSFPNHVWG